MIVTHGGHVNSFRPIKLRAIRTHINKEMWQLALVPIFPLHSLLVHTVMNNFAPFYQAFDVLTKHAWVGRATSLVTQLVALPAYAAGNVTVFHHTLGAYLAADTLHMMMYLRRDLAMWIHHGVALASYAMSFALPKNITEIMLRGSFLLELSNPLVHVSWFLNKMGYAGQWWFKYLAGTTVANYFMTRCVLFPKYVATEVPPSMQPFAAVFIVLNLLWFVQLLRYAINAVRKGGAERTE